MLAVAACPLATGGGPIIFAHRRVGFSGKPFDCYKFRTMRPDAAQALERYLADNPEATADEAAIAVRDAYDAAHALIDRYGSLASDDPEVAADETERRRMHGGVGLIPGDRVLHRPDGLSPAGSISMIVLGEPRPLQDFGCFLPEVTRVFRIPSTDRGDLRSGLSHDRI